MTERIRIFLKAADPRVLDKSAAQLVETASFEGVTINGPVPLPAQTQKTTSQVVHRRRIDLLDPSPPAIEALQRFLLPQGVTIELRLGRIEPQPSPREPEL